MAGKVVWNGPAIQARIRSEFTRRIKLCCLLVVNRAKELLNVEGTGIRQETSAEAGNRHKKARIKGLRAEISTFNKAHKLGIGLGQIKRRRLTKAGTFTDRRKARKTTSEGLLKGNQSRGKSRLTSSGNISHRKRARKRKGDS